jgi:predicted ATPase/C4-dicarboxylate-specific signal transduction histidine kinase
LSYVVNTQQEHAMLSLPGYQITEEVHRGTKTIIYRGCREHDLCPVLFKTTSAEYPALGDLARMQHEYNLTNAWDEEGLIRAYALVPYQNTQVLILQDIGGVAVKQLLAGQALPLDRFLTLALAFAKSLNRIHQHHIIHKDINPTNLVVNPANNQTHIIDFGISSQLSREMPTLQNPGRLEGTLAYLSPEQTGRMNRALDYRTDFYSLGASFYEMLTGVPPFSATDPMELVHCHLAKMPRPPHEICPHIPTVLSQLVLKLMAKTAESRYQSAFGLIADLETCRELLSAKGASASIAAFPLGRHDVSERFQIPQKLYGREDEVRQVLEAFARVSLGHTEILLVAGYSGVGKSALVHEVHKPITQKNGYFIEGKFDQFQRDIPYASLIQAFRELLRQLMTESPARVGRWKALLTAALGPNAQVIIDVIPEVGLILGTQSPVPTLPQQEARNRFQASLRQFIEVFAQAEHPLVLFLDDLQWADSASLQFLEDLLLKSLQQYLLILGAYRDNEVHAAHPFMAALEVMRRGQAGFSILSLQPLSFSDLKRLVGDTLTPSQSDITPLAELVLHKTGGNPFFVNAFLTCLHEAGWLTFSAAAGGWQWDMAHIQAQQITDNVVELMSQKLRTLPPASQALLVRAACIGHQFDLATLAVIAENTASEVMRDLWHAVKAGLLQRQGEFRPEEVLLESTTPGSVASYRFRFIHDRVQQAAYELLPAAETTTLHLKLGRLWLKQLDSGQADDTLFAVVNQFHAAQALIDGKAERVRLAQLNLQASRKAIGSSAFLSAARYLTSGLALLDGGDWEQQYELTLALSLEHAECAYINHQHDTAERYFKIGLAHAKTGLEKARIHLKQLDLYGSQGDYQRAIEEGLAGLRHLGKHLPMRPSKLDLMLEFGKERWQRRGRKVKPLLDRLPMTQHQSQSLSLRQNPKQQLAIGLFSGIIPFAFFSNPRLVALASTKAVNLFYRHGVTQDAAFILMTFSSIFTVFKQYDAAWDYAQSALDLSQDQSANSRCMTQCIFATHISHWYQPINASIAYYDRSLKLALEIGNWSYATLSMANHLPLLFGVDLLAFKEQAQHSSRVVEQISDQLKVSSWFLFCVDLATCLISKNSENSTNSADSTDADNLENSVNWLSSGLVEQAASATKNSPTLFFTYTFASFNALLFGDFAQANAYLKKAREFLFAVAGLYISVDYFYLNALIMLGDAAAPALSAKDSQILQRGIQKLQTWAAQCPENFAHKYFLVAAEAARIDGRREQAADLYDQSILAAQENGFVHDQAFACEWAARFYLGNGKAEFARIYIAKAHYLYTKWGAHAKVKHMDLQYATLLTKAAWTLSPTSTRTVTLTNTNTSTSTNTNTNTHTHTAHDEGTRLLASESLDLATVMKATQAISGEIVLGLLLEKLMRIVIENAGAQHGALLLETEGEWRIEAAGNVNNKTVSVLQSHPLVQSLDPASAADAADPIAHAAPPALPVSLIQYVALTKEALVLDNACAQGRFVNDPCISQNQSKSVLCMPIINQGKLVGMLYLENRLIHGAFNSDRLEVLKILSSQAAISIENARVYENLESTVAQRTAALSESHTALSESHNALSLAYTVAETSRQHAQNAEQKATQALDELRSAQTQLIQSEKMASLGQLVAGVAHELNTPIGNALAAASAFAESSRELDATLSQGEIRKSTLTDFIDNAIMISDVINRSCQIAATLINSFKQVAVDQTSEQRRTFELRSLVDDNIAALRAGFKHEPWAIEADIPADIECDSYPGPLGQVIANLVQNAVIHGFEGRPAGTLKISASMTAPTASVQMVFLDDGKGMDASTLARIFEPFYTTRLAHGGTGLGLSISLNIVTGVLGGTLQATSEPGCGSQFTLTFPQRAQKRTG